MKKLLSLFLICFVNLYTCTGISLRPNDLSQILGRTCEWGHDDLKDAAIYLSTPP